MGVKKMAEKSDLEFVLAHIARIWHRKIKKTEFVRNELVENVEKSMEFIIVICQSRKMSEILCKKMT